MKSFQKGSPARLLAVQEIRVIRTILFFVRKVQRNARSPLDVAAPDRVGDHEAALRLRPGRILYCGRRRLYLGVRGEMPEELCSKIAQIDVLCIGKLLRLVPSQDNRITDVTQ